MSTLFKSSSRTRSAAPMLLATIACSFLALHCSSDDTAPTGTSGTGNMSASGSGSGGGGSPSAGGSSAGMAMAGMPAAGSSTGGNATAGAAGTATAGAGTGGASGGAGGSGGGGAGGSAGGSGGSGGSGGGGNNVTFAQVKEVLAMSCATGQCHVAGNPGKHMDWATDTAENSLYTRLTTAIPANIADCAGKTPIKPGDVNESFLAQVITTGQMCGTTKIARMPDDCPDKRMCLSDDKIKLIKDWVSAGAPK
jgi:hypothetical protein